MKKQKGITLVVLTIMVIVLLILAGVSITSILSKNGIINNVINSKNLSEEKEIKEQIQVEIFNKRNEKIWNILTKEEVEKILSKYGTVNLEGEQKTITTENGTIIDVTDIYNEAMLAEEN